MGDRHERDLNLMLAGIVILAAFLLSYAVRVLNGGEL